MEVKTLHEIITSAWQKTGKRGAPTIEYIRAWRAANPLYGRHSLLARFKSGSTQPLKPRTALDVAGDEWLAANPRSQGPPSGPEFEARIAELQAIDRATELPEVTAKRERIAAEMAAYHAERTALEKRVAESMRK